MTLYTTLRGEIADALLNRNRGDLAQYVFDLSDDSIHEGERLMVDEIERRLTTADNRAKERSTCSVCLARTYRHEECVCEDDGDAEDYNEALAEELGKDDL